MKTTSTSAESLPVWEAQSVTQDRVPHRVHIGLTAEQVAVVLGQPPSIQQVTVAVGVAEVWHYATHRVTLRNGVVTGVVRTR